MPEQVMSQAAAAERAWRWAATAEAYMLGGDHESAADARDMSRTWAAVAGQLEFVAIEAETEAPTETLRVPLDLLGPRADETAVIEPVCACRHPNDPHPVGGFGCVHAARSEADYRPHPASGP